MVILTMPTMLVLVVMVPTDELHGWPELFTGVVGLVFCKICSYPCLVRCLLHVGIIWANFGSVGVSLGLPTSSFDIHQRRLGSSA